MVKELLREQQELKEQLNSKDKKPKSGPPLSKKSTNVGLNKKSSERVPRQAPGREAHLKMPSSRDREQRKEVLNVPLQLKPGEGNPKNNLK